MTESTDGVKSDPRENERFNMKLMQDKASFEANLENMTERLSHKLSEADILRLRKDLLRRYDKDGRALPWRVRPEDRKAGVKADPYAVWLSEIMLQQTTVPHATPYWERFLSEFPTVTDLANADRDRVLTLWAGLGYYARARNLHKCAEVIRDEHAGMFPSTEAQLLKLPGIGPYTAAAIAAICFGEATNIVDGNVERVISRFFAVEAPLPKSRKLLRALAGVLADPKRPGDYGQAIMDLGSKTCTPRSPICSECPWQKQCQAFAKGAMTDYPKKIKKTPRPVRLGAVFILTRGTDKNRELLISRRPDAGLLGGMMGFLGTPWTERAEDMPDKDLQSAPVERNWQKIDGEVRHIFTHFELRLRVYQAGIPKGASIAEAIEADSANKFVPLSNIADYALPTVMKKALKLALETG